MSPRKSIVGAWELITMKIDGEEVDYGFVEIIAFNADSTGHSEIYLNGELYIPRRNIAWEVNRDSISITPLGGETLTHWYSCTDDRLILRKYIDEYDYTNELIYARMEEE